MGKLLLTIDVGTTAIKFNLYDKLGVIYSSSKRIKTLNKNGESIQNPIEILELIKQTTKTIGSCFSEINQISLSTAMHTLIPEKSGEPLKMYLWSDNRASETIESFKQKKDIATLFYKKTGTPIHGMSPFAKLLYFKENQFDWYQEVTNWLDIKSYLMNYLTNQCVVDYSVASATGIFNSETLTWDEEILDYLAINKNKLPKLVHPKTAFNLSEEVSQRLGLKKDTTVMVGSSDGCLVSLGSFNQTKSPMTLTLGTSGAIRKLSSSRYLSPSQNTFCYYLEDDLWVIGGPTNNGGVIIEWLSELLFDDKETIFNSLENLIKTPNLIFYPYLQGERAPLWDESKTGSFEGLTISHGKKAIIQSVLEGLIFNLKLILEQLPSLKSEEVLVLSGGVVKNKIIAQMIATILNHPCLVSSQTEPSQGLKDWWYQGNQENKTSICFYPNQGEQNFYQEKYEKFKTGLVNKTK